MTHRGRLALVALGFVLGCSGSETKKDAGPAPPKKITRVEDDKVGTALGLFRQGTDAGTFREGLQLVQTSFLRDDVQPRLALRPESRAWLAKHGLSADDLSEVASTSYLPRDAHYVEAAVLFRDAARSLEVRGADVPTQAAFLLDWVARRVMLHQPGGESLPPAHALRAGFGGAATRAQIFLALLAQFRLDGVLLAAPGATDPALVAVLHDQRTLLFDPRLGLPVRKGSAIAGYAQLKAESALGAVHGLTPETLAKLEPRIAAPLEGLSPRMEYLESLLAGDETHIGSDRVGLFVDGERLAKRCADAGLPGAALWQPATGSPLAALRTFLPPEEGGVDRTQQVQRFSASQAPLAPALQQYARLRLFNQGELADTAREQLFGLTAELLQRYYVEPQEMLVRGKGESIPTRLDRIRTAVDEAEFADPQTDAELLAQALQWRDRVNEATLAAVRKEPDAAERLRKIWSEDQYLLALRDPDPDVSTRGKQKRALSRIVLSAVKEPLGVRTNWLLASLSHDKAERAEAAFVARTAAGQTGKSARNFWLDARSGWAKYLDRSNLGFATLGQQVTVLRQRREAREGSGLLRQWEHLQLDLHHYVTAKLLYARALERSGLPAAPILDGLEAEVKAALADGAAAKELDACLAAVRSEPALATAFEALRHEWAPDGAMAAMAPRVASARAALAPAP